MGHGRKRHLRAAAKPPRVKCAGPRSTGLRVVPWEHANEAIFERVFEPYNVPVEDVLRLIRQPNSPRLDEPDPHESGERWRRWVDIEVQPGRFVAFRVVYIITQDPTDLDPGTIEIVTIFPDDKP